MANWGEKSIQELFEHARKSNMPAGFNQWEESDGNGWTVAHEAAKHGHLPHDYDEWAITDAFGVTVAHIAAEYGHLPNNFNQWGLSDYEGDTVAHVAARNYNLPDGFDQWDLTDGEGNTVAFVAGEEEPKLFVIEHSSFDPGRKSDFYIIRTIRPLESFSDDEIAAKLGIDYDPDKEVLDVKLDSRVVDFDNDIQAEPSVGAAPRM